MKKYESIIAELAEREQITVDRCSNGRGCAYRKERLIRIPKNLGRKGFLIALHEVGHIVQGKIRPQWVSELLAERFAVKTARQYGIKVTVSDLNDIWSGVVYQIHKACRRGLKTVPTKMNRHNFLRFDLSKYRRL